MACTRRQPYCGSGGAPSSSSVWSVGPQAPLVPMLKRIVSSNSRKSAMRDRAAGAVERDLQRVERVLVRVAHHLDRGRPRPADGAEAREDVARRRALVGDHGLPGRAHRDVIDSGGARDQVGRAPGPAGRAHRGPEPDGCRAVFPDRDRVAVVAERELDEPDARVRHDRLRRVPGPARRADGRVVRGRPAAADAPDGHRRPVGRHPQAERHDAASMSVSTVRCQVTGPEPQRS